MQDDGRTSGIGVRVASAPPPLRGRTQCLPAIQSRIDQFPYCGELFSYQDRVIGKRYFDGRKSLQWSQYLYFIIADELANTQAVHKARELIEQDRTYARKFVTTENEFDSALEPLARAASDALPESNILSIWTRKLTEAGIDRAVITDDKMPARLKCIESSSTAGKSCVTVPVQIPTDTKAPFLRSMRLKRFRACPVQRFFEFGKVNLIFGVNGSGKTSLLEAIELFYCGRNKRNPKAADSYAFDVMFFDGSDATATHSRPLKTFRKNNLEWYGQAEVNTNNLFQSFAQFNFLDTDAAVSLADSTDRIQEDLSRLLVGPEASKTWRDMERLDEAVIGKLRELRRLQTQMKDELASTRALIKKTGVVKQESDSILKQLEEMVQRVGWAMPQVEEDDAAGKLVETMSELGSLARQAAAFEWADSPVSLDGLKRFSDAGRELCRNAETDLARLSGLRKEEKLLAAACRRCQEALRLVEEAARYVDADLPSRAAELRIQKTTVLTNSGALAGCDDSILEVLKHCKKGISVAEYLRLTGAERAATQKTATSAMEEQAQFVALRDKSMKLAQELREIASQLLASDPNPDQCPLCHTQFESGELAKHMQLGVEEHVETRARELLARVRNCEERACAAIAGENAAGWLAQFCDRVRIDKAEAVQSVLSRVDSTGQALEGARRRSAELVMELDALASNGLSVSRLDELVGALGDAGHSLTSWAKENVEQLRAQIEKKLRQASKALEQQGKTADNLHQAIEITLARTHSDIDGLNSAIAQLREKQAVANGLRQKFGMFEAYPWRGSKAFAELVIEAESIRTVAAEFQTARAKEHQAKTVLAETSKRRAELEERLALLASPINRYSHAQATLKSIHEEHSLVGAMEKALKRNRSAIEAIFGRIHAPAEFSGLGKQLTSLIRKVGGVEATLSEISTGQRAAFALSIFLAQNAQLRTAPPVVLIDDPIAHVDDLNSLCFFDYLREVVLAGGRQIMFATASAKLATLFERKFDFLGDAAFRRFDLLR